MYVCMYNICKYVVHVIYTDRNVKLSGLENKQIVLTEHLTLVLHRAPGWGPILIWACSEIFIREEELWNYDSRVYYIGKLAHLPFLSSSPKRGKTSLKVTKFSLGNGGEGLYHEIWENGSEEISL